MLSAAWKRQAQHDNMKLLTAKFRTAAPQKLALTLIPTWMSTPALLQLGLSLLSNLRGHNLSTGVDRAAETPAPSTAHHDDAQAPAPAPHHALKLVTTKTPYGRSCRSSYGWCRFGLRKELQTCHPLHVVRVPFNASHDHTTSGHHLGTPPRDTTSGTTRKMRPAATGT